MTGAPVTPVVTVAPSLVNVAPSEDVSVRVEEHDRADVEAPTVVSQGPAWSEVAAPGPELPAEAFTLMPAVAASRNASSTGSLYALLPPLMEKLMTSTPSRIACWTAATESEL